MRTPCRLRGARTVERREPRTRSVVRWRAERAPTDGSDCDCSRAPTVSVARSPRAAGARALPPSGRGGVGQRGGGGRLTTGDGTLDPSVRGRERSICPCTEGRADDRGVGGGGASLRSARRRRRPRAEHGSRDRAAVWRRRTAWWWRRRWRPAWARRRRRQAQQWAAAGAARCGRKTSYSTVRMPSSSE